MARPLKELIAPDWAEALADVEDQIHAMGDFLRQELAEGRSYLPAGDNVLRAFSRRLDDAVHFFYGGFATKRRQHTSLQ